MADFTAMVQEVCLAVAAKGYCVNLSYDICAPGKHDHAFNYFHLRVSALHAGIMRNMVLYLHEATISCPRVAVRLSIDTTTLVAPVVYHDVVLTDNDPVQVSGLIVDEMHRAEAEGPDATRPLDQGELAFCENVVHQLDSLRGITVGAHHVSEKGRGYNVSVQCRDREEEFTLSFPHGQVILYGLGGLQALFPHGTRRFIAAAIREVMEEARPGESTSATLLFLLPNSR